MKYFLIFFMLTDDGAAYAAGDIAQKDRPSCIASLQKLSASKEDGDNNVYFCSRSPLSQWGRAQ